MARFPGKILVCVGVQSSKGKCTGRCIEKEGWASDHLHSPLWNPTRNQRWYAPWFRSQEDNGAGCPRPNQAFLGIRWNLAYRRTESLCTQVQIYQTVYYKRKPRHAVGWESRAAKNEGIDWDSLLLATYAGRYWALCAYLSCVPTRQGRTEATRRAVRATTRSRLSMGENNYGLHHFFAEVKRVWHDYGRGR